MGCGQGNSVFSACDAEGVCEALVETRLFSGTLPLSPRSGFWHSSKGPKKFTIELGPQLITNPQWPNPAIKQVTVSAARTGREIAIRLEWDDPTADSLGTDNKLYTDQAALLFPVDRTRELPPITMGAEGQEVNIWVWKPIREPAPGVDPLPSSPNPVEDLNAEGFSTLTRQPRQDVWGRAHRNGSGWEVVFKRALTDEDPDDAQFVGSTPLAIAVWDGGNRETNGQKGISPWIFLKFV